MADIKALLKEARKLVDEKKYNEAQECCKSILRKDKQNYLGLVLLGKSLQESEQAPLAYQKAIACKADNPLAWFGLASYYEKKDEPEIKTKLLTIYNDILKLQLDDEKIIEVLTKMGQLGFALKSSESIHFIKDFIKTIPSESKVLETAEEQLIKLLSQDIPCQIEDLSEIIEILKKINAKNPTDSLELIIAKVIMQGNDFSEAAEDLISLGFLSHNDKLRNWFCQLLCQKYIDNGSFSGFNVEKHLTLIAKSEENKLVVLLKSILLFEKGMYADAYKICVPVINYNQPDYTEAVFILKCTVKLEKWSITEKLAKVFSGKAKDTKLVTLLNKMMFLSLARQQKWSQAVAAAKNVALQALTQDEQVLLAECLIELKQNVDDILKNLQGTNHFTQLKALQMLKLEKFTEVVELLQEKEFSENPLSLLYLGIAFWKLEQYESCLINLLKSAKLDPNNAKTFLYLGHYYNYYIFDLTKAKKCYEKAYNLNTFDSDILRNLSETYSKLGMKEQDVEILNIAEKTLSGNNYWINYRLGLHYLNSRDWENAITNFRIVIKQNQRHAAAFECLADSYYGRGSYTSALRAYTKVMDLDSKRTPHCQTRMGYIYSLLTQYNEAIKAFGKVLTLDSGSVLALKGVAETWMRIAKKKLEAKLFGSARECAQNSINFVTKALNQKQYTCLWKMLGDTLMFLTKLPNNFAYAYVKEAFNESNESLRKDGLDLYTQALTCYARVSKEKQELSSLDLASTYFALHRKSKKQTDCNIAFNLTMECLKKRPMQWRNWNLLGKIFLSINKYALSQHCFIKAIGTSHKWSVAKIWCNLGTLYLKLKLNKLANYCFWRGQSTLPSYPHSWIGQGLIAEVLREEEAMDLFRHASRLGYHRESALGYADWVCRTLKTCNGEYDKEFKYVIQALHAVSYSIDLMEWFTCFETENACAYTILGILQERFGTYNASLTSFERALQYAEAEKKNIAHLNLARINLRLENYDTAIRHFKAITEASLDSACGLALSLYKKGLYEEAYSAYDTALQWLSNEDAEKSDLLVAMAGILYKFKGPNDAKTVLFHSIQLSQKKPSPQSLFAICSLGLLHSDQSLSKLALSELRKYEHETQYAFVIGFLKSYILVCEKDIERAVKVLSESVHDHPNIAGLWFCIAEYCLMMKKPKGKIASSCAQKALISANDQGNECNPAKIMATASIAEYIAGDKQEAFMLSKKGLHLYPGQVEMWAALLFSIASNKDFNYLKGWAIRTTENMKSNLKISQPMSRWVRTLENKLVA